MLFILVFHRVLVASSSSVWRDISSVEVWSPPPASLPRVTAVHLIGQPRGSTPQVGRREGPPKMRFTLSSQPHIAHRMFFMRGLVGSTAGLKLHASARAVSIAESASKSNHAAAARCQA